MASNPFQRFARGAAPSTAPVPSPTAAHSTVSGLKTEASSAAARKRKRSIKAEPAEEPLPPSSTPPTSEAIRADHEQRNGSDRRLLLLEKLVEARRDGPDAAIDIYGTQACVFQPHTTSLATQRFQILVAALLSSQTQDPITHAAMQRLHTLLPDPTPPRDDGDGDGDAITNDGVTIDKIRSATVERLTELLVPVGFYRRKAQQLKQVADTFYRDYKSDIPQTLSGLLALPGVGPKIARVVLLLAWDRVEEGLIVDTHVHRLAQRLGWVGPHGTKTPEQTRVALDEWVPRAYWRDFSRHVVGFGQNVCVAIHPKCIECPLAPQCPSAFTYRHPAKASTTKKPKAKTSTPPLLQEVTMVAIEYEQRDDDASDDAFETV